MWFAIIFLQHWNNIFKGDALSPFYKGEALPPWHSSYSKTIFINPHLNHFCHASILNKFWEHSVGGCLSVASFHNRTIALAIRDVGEVPCGLRLPLKVYSKLRIKWQVVAFHNRLSALALSEVGDALYGCFFGFFWRQGRCIAAGTWRTYPLRARLRKRKNLASRARPTSLGKTSNVSLHQSSYFNNAPYLDSRLSRVNNAL